MGAIVREVGMNWARFVAIWSTAIAYIVAVAYYQVVTFAAHPMSSLAYLLAALLIIAGVVFKLKQTGNVLAKIKINNNKSHAEQTVIQGE
jgi:ferrous iron transport protein B